ncbi:hypothetical protein [Candidatus Symbiopectobacterium sp. NZEC135]|uniref:hypothetical protein n=1 Tax=Candidatus Symbiopectobacterium sp. NZEC135 TaxID=2820471 RepID=UPI002227FB3D|nr:hypothetical protein [Candidatus Symbiopectobacterium sp. NZEC135]MCW2479156.1 hypothetical protein [Candidatus Symbiopectobacterium sp. NZEC135]
MSQEIANASPQFDSAISPELVAELVKALAPEFNRAIKDAIELVASVQMAPTMTKQEFARINNLSPSLLEKWIANGVVLLAPTPTSTVTRAKKDKQTGEVIGQTVMTKHGNPLINLEAWREKNRQHAIKCRYIKP